MLWQPCLAACDLLHVALVHVLAGKACSDSTNETQRVNLQLCAALDYAVCVAYLAMPGAEAVAAHVQRQTSFTSWAMVMQHNTHTQIAVILDTCFAINSEAFVYGLHSICLHLPSAHVTPVCTPPQPNSIATYVAP